MLRTFLQVFLGFACFYVFLFLVVFLLSTVCALSLAASLVEPPAEYESWSSALGGVVRPMICSGWVDTVLRVIDVKKVKVLFVLFFSVVVVERRGGGRRRGVFFCFRVFCFCFCFLMFFFLYWSCFLFCFGVFFLVSLLVMRFL